MLLIRNKRSSKEVSHDFVRGQSLAETCFRPLGIFNHLVCCGFSCKIIELKIKIILAFKEDPEKTQGASYFLELITCDLKIRLSKTYFKLNTLFFLPTTLVILEQIIVFDFSVRYLNTYNKLFFFLIKLCNLYSLRVRIKTSQRKEICRFYQPLS